MTDVQLAVFRSLVDDYRAWGSVGPGSISRNIELATLCPAALDEIDRLREENRILFGDPNAPKPRGIIRMGEL